MTNLRKKWVALQNVKKLLAITRHPSFSLEGSMWGKSIIERLEWDYEGLKKIFSAPKTTMERKAATERTELSALLSRADGPVLGARRGTLRCRLTFSRNPSWVGDHLQLRYMWRKKVYDVFYKNNHQANKVLTSKKLFILQADKMKVNSNLVDLYEITVVNYKERDGNVIMYMAIPRDHHDATPGLDFIAKGAVKNAVANISRYVSRRLAQ